MFSDDDDDDNDVEVDDVVGNANCLGSDLDVVGLADVDDVF